MDNPYLKKRSIPTSTRSFSEQRERAEQAAKGSGGGGGRYREHWFDKWWPKEKQIWFAICPTQSYDIQYYSSKVKRIIEEKDSFYFAHKVHRIAAGGKTFVCSSGPHRNQPCWGCGTKDGFYLQKDEKEERTGIKEAGEAPLNENQQFAFPGVLLEPVAKIKQKDEDGKPKKNKKGEPYYRQEPLAMLPLPEQAELRKEGAVTFGMKVYYSMGIQDRDVIFDFDKQLRNYCCNCGDEMCAQFMVCKECGEDHPYQDNGGPMKGQSLTDMRKVNIKCEAEGCGYFGPMLPRMECACGDPEEGALQDFALRLKIVKVGEKGKQLQLTEVKLVRKFVEQYPDVLELLTNPLPLETILAPHTVDEQEKFLGDLRKSGFASTSPKKLKAQQGDHAVSYGLDDNAAE